MKRHGLVPRLQARRVHDLNALGSRGSESVLIVLGEVPPVERARLEVILKDDRLFRREDIVRSAGGAARPQLFR